MNLKKFAPLAVSFSLLAGGLTAPSIASAEVSASLALSNMYFWRGQNLTPSEPAISGSLDYANDSGFYAGVWGTNEGVVGLETDVYFGFAGEAGGFSYDVSYWAYLYPESVDGTGSDSLGDTMLSDIVLSGGFADFAVTLYIAEETQGGPDATYYTLDYTTGKYNILYGAWDIDDSAANEYSHFTLTYSYSDNLSFAVSMASNDSGFDPGAGGITENPLFIVTYSVPLTE